MKRLCRLITLVAFVALATMPLRAQLNTEQVMRIGRNALFFDDYMVAIQYFNKVIEAKPYMAQPYFYRAVAKLSLDDFAGAEADATLALERNSYITDAYEVRAVARQNLGLAAEAIDDYRRALADKPDNRNALYNLALAQLDTRDTIGASETFGTLIRRFPRYDGGYVARARMLFQKGDTIAAAADVDRAIELNANAVNAYIMRAEIALAADTVAEGAEPSPALERALADMDVAIRLQPRAEGLYINRAVLRYRADDYVGAMADMDHALELDPVNLTALYNRALLRAEVHDFNNAIADLSRVIENSPTHYRALFNRATLCEQIGDYDRALADVNTVIDAFPTFAAALYLRSAVNHRLGRERAADADYRRSLALARETLTILPGDDVGTRSEAEADTTSALAESQDAVAARFSSLLRVDDIAATPRDYSASGSTRGKIQDTDFAISLEPMFVLSYYAEPTELKPSTDYLAELDELNASGALDRPLQLVGHTSTIDHDIFLRHSASIESYTSYISTHTPRAVDYLGRALDYTTLRDYSSAIADLDRALAASPDFAVALLMRSALRYKQLQAESADPEAPHGREAAMSRQAAVEGALADLDAAIALSPRMAVAWYNKGCILASEQRYHEARDAFSHAIALKPDMGEAYYNRGYVGMRLGDKASAFTDLSRAGELGIAPAYNLIKRMSR